MTTMDTGLRIAFLLLCTSVFLSSASRSTLSQEHAHAVFQLHSGQKVPRHEVVYPYEAHPKNKHFLTHNLDSYHERARRHVAAEGLPMPEVAYKLSAFGEDVHLHLWHHEELAAETLITVLSSEDGLNRTMFGARRCHFKGEVRSHDDAHAVLSNCDGLHGTFFLNGKTHIIKPLESHLHDEYKHSTDKQARPHVIFRRSAVMADEEEDHCYVHAQQQLDRIPLEVEGMELRTRNLLRSRQKRQAIKNKYHVEIMLVVDQEMFKKRRFKTIEEAQDSALTLANLASFHYNSKMLGTDIQLVINRIELLNKTEPGLVLNHNSEKSLRNFCWWQQRTRYVPYDSDPKHYDLAVLLTGFELCAYQDHVGCSELGRAYVSGACYRYRMCSVIHDNGLTAGFVLAHEIGHNLGISHDGEGNVCRGTGSLMMPTISGRSKLYNWSKCSKHQLKVFLRRSIAYCLQDSPAKNHLKPQNFIGRTVNATEQCKLWLGEKSYFCPYKYAKQDTCSHLWCVYNYPTCRTSNVPAALGTSCGHNKICYKGKCVEDTFPSIDSSFALPTSQPAIVTTLPPPVWSDWTPHGLCSRTCGGGIQYFMRHCNIPGTKTRSTACDGKWFKYALCNTEECQDGGMFLKNACYKVAQNIYSNRTIEWFPGYLAAMRCRLFCRSTTNRSINYPAPDGTPCSYSSNDRCIHGKCMPFGCDNNMHSKSGWDKCGVCLGNGSSCVREHNSLNVTGSMAMNVTVFRLPKGARSINIKEIAGQSTDESYLMLETLDGIPIVDGSWLNKRIRSRVKIYVSGTMFTYRRMPNKPILTTTVAALNEDILVKVVRLASHSKALQWKYYLHPTTRDDRFIWTMSSSICSVTCGKGTITQRPHCLDMNTRRPVEKFYCNERRQPPARSQSCVRPECPTPKPVRKIGTWEPQSWGTCSASCGGGHQWRYIYCKVDGRQANTGLCSSGSLPPVFQQCNTYPCSVPWTRTPWRQCTATCGGGTQYRFVYCLMNGRLVDYCAGRKPRVQRPCNTHTCPAVHGGWTKFTDWDKCSRSCGGGVRSKTRACTNPRPKNGGRPCVGPKKILQLCNYKTDCPQNTVSYRSYQCAMFNNKTAKWVPDYNSLSACDLVCRESTTDVIKTLSSTAVDGTRCSLVNNDRCISGRCKKTGCNGMIGSTSIADQCGVCNGNGSTCKFRSQRYAVKHVLTGIYKVGTIEPHARYFNVSMPASAKESPLVLANSNGQVFFAPHAKQEQTVRYASPYKHTFVMYERARGYNTISIPGPLPETVVILLNVTTGSPSSPRINWEYNIEKRFYREPDVRDQYTWTVKPFGCSVSCGKGHMRTRTYCQMKATGRKVHTRFCLHTNRPAPVQVCTKPACPPSFTYEYQPSSWTACSATCGGGTRRRSVQCIRQQDKKRVDAVFCRSQRLAPVATQERCNTPVCLPPATWELGNWSPCSTTCGEGRQHRRAICRKMAASQSCTETERPNPAPRPCNLRMCVKHGASRCVDEITEALCALVVKYRLCRLNIKYSYSSACCKSCRAAQQ